MSKQPHETGDAGEGSVAGTPAAEAIAPDMPPAGASGLEGPDTASDAPGPPAAPPGDAVAPAGTAETPRFGTPGKPLDRYSPFFLGFTGALGVFAAWAVYQALLSTWSIILLILVSGFLAIGLHPAVVWLERWRLRRGAAVAVVGLLAIAVVAGMVFALAPPIVEQGAALIEAFPGYIESLKRNEILGELNRRFSLLDKIKSAATGENAAGAVGGLLGGVGLVLGTLFNIITGIILMFYFLAAFDRLKEGAYRFVPASRRPRIRLLGDEMLARVGSYLSGAVVIAGIAGASSFIFMQIIGVPYAFALALVVALLDLIPQVGATLGAVVVVIVAFFVSVGVGIAALIFFLAYQQLENWIIYPWVMRRSVNVTDLAAIVSVLVGASLLGVIGALLAIPVCAATQLIVREVVFPRQDAV